MKSAMWPVGYDFDYRKTLTVDALEARLAELAPEWPGWDHFPWRVTRNMHRYLSSPPVNFHYLMVQRCITGFAAHVLRTETFINRTAVLTMLVTQRCEFAGLLLGLLVDAMRYEMRVTRQTYILDASGPEDGHNSIPEAERTMRRARFRDNVDASLHDFG